MKGDVRRAAAVCECGHPRGDHDEVGGYGCLHGLIVCECAEFVERGER